MILVDSNIFLDIVTHDPVWKEWSLESLAENFPRGLAINPLIFAEVAANFASPSEAEERLTPQRYAWLPLPYEAGFRAGQAFKEYRKRGGQKRSPLPDFYIGAHASVAGLSILTRDPKRYRTYFPTVDLIHP